MFLSDISIKRPVLMTMVVFVFVVVGLFCVAQIGIDLFPRIDFPFISIVTVYPGAGPEEIETLINKPLEEEVSSISGVKNTNSIAQEGVSVVLIELQLGEDVNIAAIDVKDKISAIRMNLPTDIQEPVVQKFEMGAMAIISLTVSGDRPIEDLYQLVDKTIKPEMLRISGLANVEIVGAKEREIQVILSTQLMKAYGLSPLQVVGALAAENLTLPAGRIERGRSEYTLRLAGEFADVDAIRATRISTPSGPIRLDRIAEVKDDFAEMRELARFNSKPSIGMDLVKQTDANTVQVANGVYRALDKIRPLLPPGVSVDIASDRSQFIRNSVSDVLGNLLLGILFTAIVLFLFLHNWRSTLIAAVAMPISIISTFTLLVAADFTLNMMSLMGLAISVGILVVNAIVVLENIERLEKEGMSQKEAAAKGTTEIAVAVAAATLTNIVVFTPMAFMQGMIGPIFRQFGLTVAFATIFSLLISYTLTPMMASRPLRKGMYIVVGGVMIVAVWAFLSLTTTIITTVVVLFTLMAQRLGWADRFAAWWDKWYGELEHDYRIGLRWTLDHRKIVFAAITALFLFGLVLFGFIGSEFFPSYDERYFSASVEMPAGSRIEETNRVLYHIEEVVAKYPEVNTIYTSLGLSSSGGLGGAQGVQYGTVLVALKPVEEGNYPPTSEVVKDLRTKLADIPAAQIVVAEATQFGGRGGADLQIELQGENMNELAAASDSAIEIIRGTGNAVDVRSDWVVGKPEVVVKPDRIRMSDRGINVQSVAMTLRTLFEGTIATHYREEGDEYDVRVQLQEEDRNRIDRVGDLLIATSTGFVPLKDIADIEYGTGPTQVTRKNKRRMVTISANVVNVTIGEVQQEIARALELPQTPPSQIMKDIFTGKSSAAPKPSPRLPKGVTVFFGGQSERMSESFSSLLQALVLAIILTYMLLAAILESYRFPLIIMMTLPLALIGVSMSLVITGKSISIIAMMSIIMLVGIVVNNGILLIDYTQLLRSKGKGLKDAILTACPIRLRPIIMSTLATSLGMLPLALGLGAGGEIRAPMAIVAIGGLVVSTALTLFLIPVMLAAMEAKGEEKRLQRGEITL
ncbi:MAG: efflux RND transporter permease subunit [bacterium]